MMSESICSICGGKLGRELLRITTPDRFESHVGIDPSGFVRSWIECNTCGTATNVHLPENSDKLANISSGYYEIDFKSSTIGDKYSKVMSLPPFQSDNAQRVRRIIEFLRVWQPRLSRDAPRCGRVLDIGAGTGVFLSKFLQQTRNEHWSWEGVAIEPDPIAAKHLRELSMFAVIQDMFSGQLGLVDFDLCTLNKVIEHIPKPVVLLEQVRSALAMSGFLYIEVPDKLTVFHRPSDDNILGALHHHLYTMEGLSMLCGAAGLVPAYMVREFEPSGKISLAVVAMTEAAAATLAAGKGK